MSIPVNVACVLTAGLGHEPDTVQRAFYSCFGHAVTGVMPDRTLIAVCDEDVQRIWQLAHDFGFRRELDSYTPALALVKTAVGDEQERRKRMEAERIDLAALEAREEQLSVRLPLPVAREIEGDLEDYQSGKCNGGCRGTGEDPHDELCPAHGRTYLARLKEAIVVAESLGDVAYIFPAELDALAKALEMPVRDEDDSGLLIEDGLRGSVVERLVESEWRHAELVTIFQWDHDQGREQMTDAAKELASGYDTLGEIAGLVEQADDYGRFKQEQVLAAVQTLVREEEGDGYVTKGLGREIGEVFGWHGVASEYLEAAANIRQGYDVLDGIADLLGLQHEFSNYRYASILKRVEQLVRVREDLERVSESMEEDARHIDAIVKSLPEGF